MRRCTSACGATLSTACFVTWADALRSRRLEQDSENSESQLSCLSEFQLRWKVWLTCEVEVDVEGTGGLCLPWRTCSRTAFVSTIRTWMDSQDAQMCAMNVRVLGCPNI